MTGPTRGRSRLRRTDLVLSMVLVSAVATVGFLQLAPAQADNERLVGKPVPAADLSTIQSAALSCPALTGPRLAAQVMAASGFDSGTARAAGGVRGLAGLDDTTWRRWEPWPKAQLTDRRANVVALAHQTCEMVGQLRVAGVTGDPWRTAVAATRAGLQAVLDVKAVPASAQNYVDTVSAYAEWYARQPQFGGLDDAGTPSSDRPLAAAAADAKPLPEQYVADVIRAGLICAAVTPARVAAQLMAASGFDPNMRSANGAQGIAQFLPETWGQYAAAGNSRDASPWDPKAAIPMLGTVMCDLSGQLAGLTAGDPYTLGLAAFQWGTAAVRAAGGAPPTLQRDTARVLAYAEYYAKDKRLSGKPAPTPSTSASASKSPSPSPSPSAVAPSSPTAKPSPAKPKPPAPTSYTFESGTMGWKAGQNTGVVRRVTTFENRPGTCFSGGCLEAVGHFISSTDPRSVYVAPETPIDMSKNSLFKVKFNSFGGVQGATGYRASVALTGSDGSRVIATLTPPADTWTTLSVSLKNWSSVKSVTRIEVTFQAVGTSYPGWTGNFQLDNATW
ncbi:transglycosylase SLT domain-containing protein [Micromonospora sp. DT233]|uniref:transglycosylase SLT domain-containing protein n=1 Tax=Micromonospora sp. DT233 TaxID=3393432 RepID=UPI003CEA96B2